MPFSPYRSARFETKTIVFPSAEKRGWPSSAGPLVRRIALFRLFVSARMIQMSRSPVLFRSAKTMYCPSEDQSGSLASTSSR